MTATHKYILIIQNNILYTVRYEKGRPELEKYHGEKGCDLKLNSNQQKWISWFEEFSSISSDEYVDFCVVSDSETNDIFDSIRLHYESSKHYQKSSWSESEIFECCSAFIKCKNFKIKYGDNSFLVNQTTDIGKKTKYAELYMECLPEFTPVAVDNQVEQDEKGKNILADFCKERLKEWEK